MTMNQTEMSRMSIGRAPWRLLSMALAVLVTASPLHAASVLSVSPQGEADAVRQVAVRFDADMVPLGQDEGAAPASIRCLPDTPAGQARWIGPRSWAFDFDKDVSGGTRCDVAFKADLRSLAGDAVATPPASYFVAGPWRFFASYPGEGSQIASDQVFLLRHHDPQPTEDAKTLAASFSCEQLDGDRTLSQQAVAVTGPDLTAALAAAPQGRYALALRCPQPLPAGTRLRLRQKSTGDAKLKLFNYSVHLPLTARLACTVIEYPKELKACDPRQPLDLLFSAPVAMAVAKQIRLADPSGMDVPIEPVRDWRKSSETMQVRATLPKDGFGEERSFILNVPPGLQDVLGRPLANAGEFPRTVKFARLPPYLGAVNSMSVMPWQAGASPALAAFAVRNIEKTVPLKQWRLGAEAGPDIEPYAIELLQGRQLGVRDEENLNAMADAAFRTSALATQGGAMEFVGVPLSAPGLHVVRAESAAFADFLGTRKARPGGSPGDTSSQRYAVVQVTNLNPGVSFSDAGASVIWVTAFDSAQPVAEADVAVYSCRRELLWRGKTDAKGLAWPGDALRGKLGCVDAPAPSWRSDGSHSPWVVVRAGKDMALMQVSAGWGGFSLGIAPSIRGYSVLDRTLFKAGETVSMQHVVRQLENGNFTLPPEGTLDVEIRYSWSDRMSSTRVPLDTDGSATSQWVIPPNAKLGGYTVNLSMNGRRLASAQFQIEEFRTPALDTRLHARSTWTRNSQAAVLDAQLAYFAGRPAAHLPLNLKHGWEREVRSPRPDYSFYEEQGESARDIPPPLAGRDIRLDADGRVVVRVAAPPLARPLTLRTELKFPDPSGEFQTVDTAAMLWPDRLKLGLRMRAKDRERPQALEGIALDEHDRPVAGEPVAVRVKPVRREWEQGRARLVAAGPEDEVCKAVTDAQGLWACDWALPATAEGAKAPEDWLFNASAVSLKHSNAIVRTELLQHRWQLGWQETDARTALQLENGPTFSPGESVTVIARPDRLPASLLLTTEREGVMAASVHALTDMAQRITLPLTARDAPNVFLVARYVYPLPDASPTAPLANTQQVDVPVRPDASTLAVDVRPASPDARPRAKVPTEIAVRDAAGQAVADARVTLIAVDEALLALKSNDTWRMATSMLAKRGKAVVSTALDANLLRQIVLGARPQYLPNDEFPGFPAPAPPAAARMMSPGEREPIPPRTDFSSLILWRTDLRTDAHGIARTVVPLNDALTQFRIVAIVSAGATQFGQGEATITSTQPLQIFSGLPAVLRADDAIVQKLSLRNTGMSPLSVLLDAEAAVESGSDRLAVRESASESALAARGLKLRRRVNLPPGKTQDIRWSVAVPSGTDALHWRIHAQSGSEQDRLEITQRVVPALPVTVRQSTLLAVAGARDVPVVQPRDAVPLSGGIRVGLQASLVDAALTESAHWMTQYPYICLEQQSSRFVSLDDRAGWERLMADLPKYVDDKGLARFFPEATLPGSEMLTVQLLDLAHAKGWPVPEEPRRRMLDALEGLLESRFPMQDWTPDNALEPQQLAAQATLAEHGRTKIHVRPRTLDTLSAQSLVDWTRTLMASPDDADRASALKKAGDQLRSRFDVQGTRMRWRDEPAQHWWWFMWSGDSTAARLALLAQQWALTDAAWKADAPLITQGLVGRQSAGRWSTTTGNAWSTVALRRFQQQFEAVPVSGVTRATMGGATRDVAWPGPGAPAMLLPWPAQGAQATLQLRHEGNGTPWATVSTLAAVRNARPVANGLVVRRSVSPVQQKRKGQWSVGDAYRVRLDLESTAAQTWVVVRDAVPSGASQIGRGLGRESRLARQDETTGGQVWPSHVERATDSYRAYFRHVPRGKWHVEYTAQLNNAGAFRLPPVRVEAMYAPEVFGEGLAEVINVKP